MAANDNGADIIYLDAITPLGMSVARVFQKASQANLEEIIIIGLTKDGDEYFCSSIADGGDALWHLERAKHKLVSLSD